MKGRLFIYVPIQDSYRLGYFEEIMQWSDTKEYGYEMEGERWSKPYVPLISAEEIGDLKNRVLRDIIIHSSLIQSPNDITTDIILSAMKEDLHQLEPRIYEICEIVLNKFSNNILKSQKLDLKTQIKTLQFGQKYIPRVLNDIIVIPVQGMSDAIIFHQFYTEVGIEKTFCLFLKHGNEGIATAKNFGRILNLQLAYNTPYNSQEFKMQLKTSINSLPSLAIRNWNQRISSAVLKENPVIENDEMKYPTSSRKIFSGLIQDFQRRRVHYWSDFKEAFHYQTITSALFIYFACLCPIITFGALLSQKTEQNIGTMESLISGCFSLIIFGLFGGQPLIILGSTGPILVYETILFQLCKMYHIEYLNFRCSVGIWCFIILCLIVMLNASNLVSYVTLFTEDIFSTLISIIYIIEAIKGLVNIYHEYPIKKCNDTFYDGLPSTDHSNVFLMSLFLTCSTYYIITWLKRVENLKLFIVKLRDFICNVAVIATIFMMTLVDFYFQVDTLKLDIPDEFKHTSPRRYEANQWIIHPFGPNPFYLSFIAFGPALLAVIILFLDQQITAVIINKNPSVRKGHGYHLDILVLAFLVLLFSIIGTPWFVAATVLSLNHVNSLQTSNPAAKIREQRMTGVLIGVAIGASIMMAPLLKHVPIAVLFGVFIIMGTSSLGSLEFMKRIKLFFIPSSDQRDYRFISHVPLRRVHLYTFIQFISFILLMIVKYVKRIAIGFPLMVLAMCFIRRLMEAIFTKHELYWLDNLYPGQKPPQSPPNPYDTLNIITVPDHKYTPYSIRSNELSHSNDAYISTEMSQE